MTLEETVAALEAELALMQAAVAEHLDLLFRPVERTIQPCPPLPAFLRMSSPHLGIG